jgi:MoaA/NifB/PqqE/SkfB family radical SAM enzyme
MNYSILYRGPLSSCNYECDYCPFGKTKNTRLELADDQRKLNRFISWIEQHPQHNFGILFTPWGEALIRKYYQQGIVRLSHLSNVSKVAIQTNLSCATEWLLEANRNTTALWTTYHPTQTTLQSFVRKCKELDRLGVRYSVGMVGFKECIDEIKKLRDEVSPDVYLWINAYKRQTDYYSQQDVEALTQIDRLFEYNRKYHSSYGKSCRTGQSVFSVDGDGNMYRCHFIKTLIGNIYKDNFEKSLFVRPCVNQTCGCHIGYVHMNDLHLDEIFSGGELERIPMVS